MEGSAHIFLLALLLASPTVARAAHTAESVGALMNPSRKALLHVHNISQRGTALSPLYGGADFDGVAVGPFVVLERNIEEICLASLGQDTMWRRGQKRSAGEMVAGTLLECHCARLFRLGRYFDLHMIVTVREEAVWAELAGSAGWQ